MKLTENTKRHTESIIASDNQSVVCKKKSINEVTTEYDKYFDLDMRCYPTSNNIETGFQRLKLTLYWAARLGLISPSLTMYMFDINKRQSIEHLNKLVKKGYLVMITTHRAMDGRVYICTRDGVLFVQERLGIRIPFKGYSPPERALNQNTIMHDLMNGLMLIQLINETSRYDRDYYAYSGLMTEKEVKRLFLSHKHRVVDGLLQMPTSNGIEVYAIEIENSFKDKHQRSHILLQYSRALEANLYQRIFLISQSHAILEDIKRFHCQLLIDLTQVRQAKNGKTLLTEGQARMLEKAIIYRTKYCEDLTELFY